MSRYQFPSAGTTDASLLVSGTLSDARLSANVLLTGANYGQLATIPSSTLLCNALGIDAVAQASSPSVVRSLLGLATSSNVTFAGLTLSGLQQFTGTSTVGLRVKSLTTAEYTALTATNGDLFRDSTTDRIDARLTRGTVELIDTAGGQVIAGNLAATTLMVGGASGPLFRNSGGIIEARNNANNSGASFNATSYTFGSGGPILNVNAGVIQSRNAPNTDFYPFACSNLTASGTVRVGGGTVVQTILSATATLDFPSIGSNGTETLTITVTGAVAGDSVFLGVPAALDAGLIFCASVTAADTVTVRMHNSSGGSVDPASGTFRATVIRF